MALRAIKPEKIVKRFKALFFGEEGVGKSTAAISFPRPYIIDTEKGIEQDGYVERIEKVGGVVFQTTDFDELLKEVKSLLVEKHEYKTLVIDPLTTLYDDLLDKSATKRKSSKDPEGTAFGAHYRDANAKIKHLLSLLLRLDMNIIVTSHAKKEYSTDMTVIGTTFDCYKKLGYLFDLVLQIQKRGKERVAMVKKSRIDAFPDGDIFPFNYETVAQRYGREILEKDSVPEQLSSPEQIAEVKRLIDVMKIDRDTVQKWLDKAESHSLEEVNAKIMDTIIAKLTKKLQGEV